MSGKTDSYRIADAARADLLARLALAWDGQWFLKLYEECGWETAVRVNTRVRHAFGRIEIRLLLRVLGKRRADDLQDAARVLRTYYEEVLTAGFDGEFRVEGNALHISVSECAALAGSKRAGLERHDQACVGCPELFQVYFETLLPDHGAEIKVLEQMGYGAGRCRYVVRTGQASQASETPKG
jgi:hypothetical protein